MARIHIKDKAIMDLLSVIINPEKSSTTCCICFNRNQNCMKLDENLVFLYENEVETMSLNDIISYLVPEQEIIFNQACITCTEMLLKFHKILKRREKKINHLKTITNTFINEEYNISASTKLNPKIMLYLTENFEIKGRKNGMKKSKGKAPKDSRQSSTNIKTSTQNKSKLINCRDNPKDKNNVDSNVTCHDCKRKFSSKKKLMSHINTHIARTCPYCNKQVRYSSYYRHVKSHKTGIPSHYRTNYDCNECNYRSTCKSSLNAHKFKAHLNIRPFVCTVCNKGFYKKSNLVEHERIHNKEKHLICEECGLRFSNTKCLTQHVYIHSDVKEFKCDYCELRFKTFHRKTEHIKSQHSVKSFTCSKCDKSYGLQKELNRHIKLTHSESEFVFGEACLLDSKYFDDT